jgi:DNA-binding winged helix-turn-helix (wHTH) protein
MNDRLYQFAGFELNPATRELRRGESVIALQEKPLLLLMTLLDHPQRVVTREQLRERMWDSRTVVEYDQGINAAMKKVRDALRNSTGRLWIIETLPKRGYRLLVPVTVVVPPAPTVSATAPTADAAPDPRRSRFSRWRWIAAMIAVAIAIVAWFSRPS